VIATAVLLQLAGTVRAPTGSGEPTESALLARGQPVPDISGTTLDGQAFSLTALRGRPVIVNFWGPSCVPCRD
jgi:thiol-disulfide isomerase/thioredoxin